MIRLIQQRLIIPQGDTGSFIVPVKDDIPKINTIAVFSIFKDYNKIYSQEQQITSNKITFTLTHEETKNFSIGKYNWDVKIYINPQYNKDSLLINGDEVHSYYASYKLPECEIVPFSLDKRG